MPLSPDPVQTVTLRATGRVARRQLFSRASYYVLLAATLSGLLVLAFLAYDILMGGGGRVSVDVLTNYVARRAEDSGIRAPMLGTIWIVALVVAMSVPVGVATAIWMEEFAPKNRLLWIVRVNIGNLAGVPGIVYGILGLAIFVRGPFGFGPTIIAASLTLSLMVLPMIVIASSEAIRQVPPSIRLGSLALGATRWQTVWNHTLPGAIPGIMTGTILAISRAAGEAAVLILVGAAALILRDPASINDRFTILPVQIYNWTVRPGDQYKPEAAAAIIVLMVIVLTLNAIAIVIRNKFRRD